MHELAPPPVDGRATTTGLRRQPGRGPGAVVRCASMSLWRALMQGVGWRVGREMAEDLIASVKSDIDAPETPRATPGPPRSSAIGRTSIASSRR